MLHMDRKQPVFVHLDELPWVPSPAPGIERRPLEREAAESGRATSVVRYAAGASFPRHMHTGGEEFLVLEGVFSDESGDFPAGSYVRNPVGSRHAPRSDAGCMIFVKLGQMSKADTTQTVVTPAADWRTGDSGAPLSLYQDAHERVRMMRLATGERLSLGNSEALIVDGALSFDAQTFSALSWLRVPAGDDVSARAESPTLLWVKDRHLG